VPEAKQGAIGISGVTVDSNSSKLYGMPEGVFVKEILAGGAAESAGLPKGCIITEINGENVNSMEALQEELTYYKAGETVTVTVEVSSETGEYVEKTYEVKLMSKSKLN